MNFRTHSVSNRWITLLWIIGKNKFSCWIRTRCRSHWEREVLQPFSSIDHRMLTARRETRRITERFFRRCGDHRSKTYKKRIKKGKRSTTALGLLVKLLWILFRKEGIAAGKFSVFASEGDVWKGPSDDLSAEFSNDWEERKRRNEVRWRRRTLKFLRGTSRARRRYRSDTHAAYYRVII